MCVTPQPATASPALLNYLVILSLYYRISRNNSDQKSKMKSILRFLTNEQKFLLVFLSVFWPQLMYFVIRSQQLFLLWNATDFFQYGYKLSRPWTCGSCFAFQQTFNLRTFSGYYPFGPLSRERYFVVIAYAPKQMWQCFSRLAWHNKS